MTSHTQFYIDSLYPLQDRILRTVNSLSNPFYLTGGTALSRGYLNHRYSDDLDFFANDIKDFQKLATDAIKAIRSLKGISIIPSLTVVSEAFIGFSLKDDKETRLKIDFVNDIPYRNGEPSIHPVLGRIDSIENILTNKLSALIGRSEVKDAVDLWMICKKLGFSWKDEIGKAMEKEACIDTMLISETLAHVSEDDFNSIRWVKKPDFNTFKEDIGRIGQDMLSETGNTLAEPRTQTKSKTQKALEAALGQSGKDKGKGGLADD